MINELTPREREILILAANGMTATEIAKFLGLQYQSVRNHLTNAYRRLGARNRFEAFLELGWLTPPEID